MGKGTNLWIAFVSNCNYADLSVESDERKFVDDTYKVLKTEELDDSKLLHQLRTLTVLHLALERDILHVI